MRSDSWFCAPILIIYNCEIMGGRNTFFCRWKGCVGKWSKAVAYEKKDKKKKKQALKTKTLIEYSSILLLHSGFNKEENKPNQPHISGYEQQYNRRIIYEK